jgi:hypothetical protein
MRNFFRNLWWRVWAQRRWRNRLRDGVIAMLEVNEMMKAARWPRQRRRHFLSDLQRDPRTWVRVLEMIHAQQCTIDPD